MPSTPVVRNTSARSRGALNKAGLWAWRLAWSGALGLACSRLRRPGKQEKAREDEVKAELQQRYDLPTEPTQTFEKAQASASGHNLLVEFSDSGDLVMVENCGPKRPVTWASEGMGIEVLGELTLRRPRQARGLRPQYG